MKKHKKQRSSAWIFWSIILVLGLVMFFVNKNTIDSVLEKTQLFEKIKNRNNASPVEIIIEKPQDPAVESNAPQPSNEKNQTTPPPSEASETAPSQSNEIAALPEEQANLNAISPEKDPPSDAPASDDTGPGSDESDESFRTISLYFLKQTGSTIQLERITRKVPQTPAPLSENIRYLLNGPTASEQQAGILSLIPSQSKLLSAWVKDKVAYLNFNTAFRFNQYGREGSDAQLRQIVHTAIQFPTVDSVQILIEGEVLDFLSGDGVHIGNPLTLATIAKE